ncbi:MAG: M23 family metallopeptidase [Bacteroidetes bacterium]|nr:M23 family metallopeptidase [Bacteroidota bacterium]HET6244993.1 M23 family metallopeptidase [Bacteroidia bacterium]
MPFFYRFVCSCLSICSLSIFSFAQQEYPKDYFRSPLDIPILLSGNFGELRSNHFHAGLDMKTEGVEGKKIYAVADGYVSRIKISPWGYGKVLYITHPNGFVTVYAHLRNFNDIIGLFIKQAQYKAEEFEVELTLQPNELIVKKGDVVAFSGNTGGSGGPHLHFEIRDEKSENPINPLLFGFDIKDDVKPIIKEIILYPLSPTSTVNNSNQFKRFTPACGSPGNYSVNNPVLVNGKIGFGIDTYDLNSLVSNKVGVYTIELKVDGNRKYFYRMDRFSFDHSRCLNSHVDFSMYKKQKHWFQKLFVAPNNKLTIYHDLTDRGVLTFTKDTSHRVEFLVSDYNGNVSKLLLSVQSKPEGLKNNQEKISSKAVAFFKYGTVNEFKNENISLTFPEGVFYDDLNFEFHTTDTIKGAITPTYHVQNVYVPVNIPYNLSIRVDTLPVNVKRKALIVNVDEYGGKFPVGGDLRNDWLTANPKFLGSFTVMLDTTPPVISPLTIFNGTSGIREIKIKISDDLSGIKTYRGSIDGKWVVMEYEYKQSLLFHTFEKELSKGKHVFHLEVKDTRGNISEFTTEFNK